MAKKIAKKNNMVKEVWEILAYETNVTREDVFTASKDYLIVAARYFLKLHKI
ncbi:hypothetical protein R83H12_02874 [Fibrobacteria bacterium R8-3-H12]